MKKHINMGGSMDTILNNQGSANSGQPGQTNGGANGQKQFQITPEEVIRMKDILEQRDAEITVLVSHLQKCHNFLKCQQQSDIFSHLLALSKDRNFL